MSNKCPRRGVIDGKGQHLGPYRGDSSRLQQQQDRAYITTRREADKSGTIVTVFVAIWKAKNRKRQVCKAIKPDVREIAEPLILLQIWAWE